MGGHERLAGCEGEVRRRRAASGNTPGCNSGPSVRCAVFSPRGSRSCARGGLARGRQHAGGPDQDCAWAAGCGGRREGGRGGDGKEHVTRGGRAHGHMAAWAHGHGPCATYNPGAVPMCQPIACSCLANRTHTRMGSTWWWWWWWCVCARARACVCVCTRTCAQEGGQRQLADLECPTTGRAHAAATGPPRLLHGLRCRLWHSAFGLHAAGG